MYGLTDRTSTVRDSNSRWYSLTLLNCSACGSYDRRPHTDRASLRRCGTCARRLREWVESRDAQVLIEQTSIERRRFPTRTRPWDLSGQLRWHRMRSTTEAASINAIGREHPPQLLPRVWSS